MASVIDLLKSHRSIRKFTDEKIPPDLLQALFEAGQAGEGSMRGLRGLRCSRSLRGLAEVSGLIRGLVRLRDLRSLSCFRRGVDRVVKLEGLELPEV